MAEPIIVSEGTHTIANNNEVDVFSTATAAYYFLTLDENAITAGNTIILRIYKVILNGGAYRKVYEQELIGSKVGEGLYVPPVSSSYGWKFSIQRTAGSMTSVPYIVEKS
jgi:hypothetical protein